MALVSRSPLSSCIQRVEYDTEEGELVIEFTDGTFFTYHNVPPEVLGGLLSAASPGAYFNRNIRGVYE